MLLPAAASTPPASASLLYWREFVCPLGRRPRDDLDIFTDEYDSPLTMPSDQSQAAAEARVRCFRRSLRRGTLGAAGDHGRWFIVALDIGFAYRLELKIYAFDGGGSVDSSDVLCTDAL